MDGYLTTAQAANEIGCSQQHVRRLVAQGRIDGRAITTRLYLLEPGSVRAYAATGQRNGYPRGRPRKAPKGASDAD